MDVRLPTGEDLDRLMAGPPRMVSTALGPVEYAEAGHGPVLLSVDGSFGGWDYALGQAAVFAVNGFRVIAPSRPGYLGTPLALGRSHEEQAEVLIALLDALGVDRAAVLALCAGAGSSFVMAARHPERVSCLVEVSPVTLAYVPDDRPGRTLAEPVDDGQSHGHDVVDGGHGRAVAAVPGDGRSGCSWGRRRRARSTGPRPPASRTGS